MSFVHLHVHSEYSLLESACKIETLVKEASSLGYQALGLTDFNVMYGAVYFYKACKKYGIKPILGLDLTIKDESDDKNSHRLVLLAENEQGYKELLALSSIAKLKPNPFVLKEELRHHTNGLIAIAPCVHSQIGQLILKGAIDEAKQTAGEYACLFGEAHFFLGLEQHHLEEEALVNREFVKLGVKTNVEVCVLHEVFYVKKSDSFIYDCLICLKDDTKIQDPSRKKLQTTEYDLKSKQEMEQLCAPYSKALANTKKIADRCQVVLEFHQPKLPKYPVPDGRSAKEFLKTLCYKGIKKRYKEANETIYNRLDYELQVIDQMGFNHYFLIVWDFMKYAREKRIMTGPGRGSAAGSLVAYLLEITAIDPLKYGLLFERFLNPERVSMPDIDIDFSDRRRHEMLDYVARKYGKQHVAQIVTFGTLGARLAIRDVGRILDSDPLLVDRLAKLIPQKPKVTIKEALKESVMLLQLVEQSTEAQTIIRVALKVEGFPRHTSVHAAGVVISDQTLTSIVPILQGNDHIVLTQYPMDVLEELGLLKMDFLGLRNLSFLEQILHWIYEKTGQHLKTQDIPLDDEKTFALLARGDTSGVFQLESEGMKKVLKKLHPTDFEDIVAVNALYRPGPMEQIETYILTKHKKQMAHYLHPDLEPILQNTYGVIVYQEQIMQIAHQMAGFSLGEADLLRRAVSKKKKDVLEKERSHFIKGCLNNGYDEETASSVYQLIIRFANYGFNRSHAVAYSMMSYQLTYLKANYPVFFYAALLTSTIGQTEKTKRYMAEARRANITMLPPAINKSEYRYLPEQHGIRMSLASIKQIGAAVIKEIIQERSKKPYKHFFDFCVRVNQKIVPKKVTEILILSGCFDEFGVHRASLLASSEAAYDYVDLVKDEEETFFSLEEVLKPDYVNIASFSPNDCYRFEKEVFGFYVSGHPVEEYKKSLSAYQIRSLFNAMQSEDFSIFYCAVLIEHVRKIKTRKGELMAFLTVSDESYEAEVTAFPAIYLEYMALAKEQALVLIQVERRQQKLILKQIIGITDLLETIQLEKKLFLKIEQRQNTHTLAKVKQILKNFHGTMPVIVYYASTKKTIQLSNDLNILPTRHCLRQLEQLLGNENVIIK